MNITIQERSYEERALVAVVKIENPYEKIGWQVF